MIDLLVITDGRTDYLREAVTSAAANLEPDLIGARWMYDDTGDADHRAFLAREYPEFVHINAGARQGFGGAIRAAWAQLLERSDADQVFHLEQDFTFNRPVDLLGMSLTLADNDHLVQLVLRRQPWNPGEVAAGGIVEQHPADYTEVVGEFGTWLGHRRFFSTNPCLYRRSLMHVGWPEGEQSEGRFGVGLMERHPDWRFAFWGAYGSGEAVAHIGHQRAGVGY
jgi:hypothetical protein